MQRRFTFCLALIALGLCAGSFSLAQQAEPAGDNLPPGAERAKDGSIIYRGRLPRNYNKLGLFFKQKQDIYKVQTAYRGKIEDLQRQIDELESKRDQEIFNLLRDDQKKYLQELEKDAAKDDSSAKTPAAGGSTEK